MNPNFNPDEFAELESQLRRAITGEPSSELHHRVMHAVVANLKRSPTPREIKNFRYLVAVAASILIGLNLSIISASVTRFEKSPVVSAAQINADARSILALAPELSEDDAIRMSLLNAGGRQLPLSPQLDASKWTNAATAQPFLEGESK